MRRHHEPRVPTSAEQFCGTMFDVPDPPTGPEKIPEDATWEAYCGWRETAEGLRVWLDIEEQALAAFLAGARRIGVKALVESARSRLRVEINNTYTAWLADDLVGLHPELLPLIERRVRKS